MQCLIHFPFHNDCSDGTSPSVFALLSLEYKCDIYLVLLSLLYDCHDYMFFS